MDEIEEAIEHFHKHWKQVFGVLSIRKSTKFVNGKDIGVPCITFYVAHKMNIALTSEGYNGAGIFKIPKELYGMPTDVVELSSPDYKLGETSVSNKSPEDQRRIASGIKGHTHVY